MAQHEKKRCRCKMISVMLTVITVDLLWFLLPELGLPGGSPSWRAPRGCTRPGSGTSRRHAPAHAAGRWWRWCGCACASSWADRPCMALESCLHRSLRSSSARSVPRHTCLRTSRYLFSTQEKWAWSVYFLYISFLFKNWDRQNNMSQIRTQI